MAKKKNKNLIPVDDPIRDLIVQLAEDFVEYAVANSGNLYRNRRRAQQN